MSWTQRELRVSTPGRGLMEITGQVSDLLSGAVPSDGAGLCHLFLQHTSASLILCENADPSVLQDLEAFALRFAPDGDLRYSHVAEGADDMPAHLRSIFAGVEISVPVRAGGLCLGTWQGVYLWEHRTRPMQRTILISINVD